MELGMSSLLGPPIPGTCKTWRHDLPASMTFFDGGKNDQMTIIYLFI